MISAARPLSLQVHPDKQHAERAYTAQQQAPDAPRDQTDDNHKPELICALRDGFAGLCGFRPVPDSRRLLAAMSVAGLAEFSDRLECANPASGLRNAVTSVLTSETDVAPLIADVRQACERIAADGGMWGRACAAYAAVAAPYPADPGVLDFWPAEPTVLCPMRSGGEAPGPEADEPGAVYRYRRRDTAARRLRELA